MVNIGNGSLRLPEVPEDVATPGQSNSHTGRSACHAIVSQYRSESEWQRGTGTNYVCGIVARILCPVVLGKCLVLCLLCFSHCRMVVMSPGLIFFCCRERGCRCAAAQPKVDRHEAVVCDCTACCQQQRYTGWLLSWHYLCVSAPLPACLGRFGGARGALPCLFTGR